eukprot:354239-Chlamydomonas_euryale.AAC.1
MPLRRLEVAALRCCPDGSPAGRNASCTNSWWSRARAAVWLATLRRGGRAALPLTGGVSLPLTKEYVASHAATRKCSSMRSSD